MSGLGSAPGLGEGYEAEARSGLTGVRWGWEWAADYTLRPSQHAQRWSWQNRGGTVDDLFEATRADPDIPPVEVGREKVIAALEAWIVSTHASQLGRNFGVSQPAGRRAYAEHLLEGPVGAVLEAFDLTVVE